MAGKLNFNTFAGMPLIPYNIIIYLAQSSVAEDLWKLLKYPNSNALQQPPLTYKEKLALIWNNQDDQNRYSIFLTFQVENLQLESRTYLKIYKANSAPVDPYIATLAYEFDILTGGKTPMVEYMGAPCNRLDVAESILLQSLNGVNVGGVGMLQFNAELSRLCQSRMALIGNNTTFTGTALVLAVQIMDLKPQTC